jgi:hypothetical protein
MENKKNLNSLFQLKNMDLLFIALGAIDVIAGAILFFDVSAIAKIIAVLLITKGVLTLFKSILH